MKPSGFLVAALKSKGSDDSDSEPDEGYEEESPDSEAPSEDSYGTELASMLGVPEEDHADFNTALAGFVRACMRKES